MITSPKPMTLEQVRDALRESEARNTYVVPTAMLGRWAEAIDAHLRAAMTLERQAFEKWITAPPFERGIERYGEQSAWPGNYQDYDTQIAWNGWQAAIEHLSRAAEPVGTLVVEPDKTNQYGKNAHVVLHDECMQRPIGAHPIYTHPSEDARDAQRYRWFRDNHYRWNAPYFDDGRWYVPTGERAGGLQIQDAISYETMDAAIDAAMAKENGNG